MAKTTPWNKIKKEYLDGVPVKEIAEKYKIKPRSISDKAYDEDWKEEKARIAENVRYDVEERIKNLTNLALQALESVINDPECKHADKVSASRALLDVSGLKTQKHELDIPLPEINIEDI
jgi:hypothetical protein